MIRGSDMEVPLLPGYHAARHGGNGATPWHAPDVSVLNAQALIRRLKAIRDAHLRRRALAEMLATGDPEAWVRSLEDLLARAATTDDADAQAAVDCLTHAVASDILPYESRTALYAAGRDAGADAVARLFLDASPPTVSERALEAALEPERPLRPDCKKLTLGERKSLARTTRRDVIVPLLRDPHPDVVAILLDNPHLTERDVVVIASLRPAVPAALALVAEHARWSPRYAVKRALVLNPSMPAHLAVRLATTLRRADLIEIARDLHLPSMLRAHAADLLAGARSRGPRDT
jgi:hypothetical protein